MKQLNILAFILLFFSCHSPQNPESTEVAFETKIKESASSPSVQKRGSNPANSDTSSLISTFLRMDTWVHRMLENSYPEKEDFQRFVIKCLDVKDVDFDGIDELIYCGPSGGEPSITCIYEQSSDSLICTFGEMQYIESFSEINDSVTEIVVSNPGCCMSVVDYIQRYYYINGVDSIYSILDKKTAYVNYMNREGSESISRSFTTGKGGVELRAVPSFVHEVNGEPNVLCELTDDYEALASYAEKDSSGREWWFVEIAPLANSSEHLYGDDGEVPIYHTGWMINPFQD